MATIGPSISWNYAASLNGPADGFFIRRQHVGAVEAIAAFVGAGTRLHLPLTIVLAINDEFKVGTTTYTLAATTYTTASSVAAAVNAATKSGGTFDDDWTAAADAGQKLTFTANTAGDAGNGDVLHSGTHDALTALGFVDGQFFANGADSDESPDQVLVAVIPYEGPGAYSYRDLHVIYGDTYDYEITAYNQVGEVQESDVVALSGVEVVVDPPDPPLGAVVSVH
jgi:hypothetical protein